MESFKIRVGRPITPEQLEELSDEQLVRLVPKAYREFFPGKDFCADGHFYLHMARPGASFEVASLMSRALCYRLEEPR